MLLKNSKIILQLFLLFLLKTNDFHDLLPPGANNSKLTIARSPLYHSLVLPDSFIPGSHFGKLLFNCHIYRYFVSVPSDLYYSL